MNLAPGADKRLESYLSDIGNILKYPKRKSAFATYIVGLFSMVERKTAEGLAALSVPDETRIDAEHQRLLHVIGQSKWNDRAVRRYAAKYALEAMPEAEQTESWIVDDTGIIKKGTHSVGVQRQYTGTSGKVDNCQIGVSLVATTKQWQIPLDFELYLPEVWMEDSERRRRAKIPENLSFRTKEDLSLGMIDRALEDGLPRPKIILADAAYGRSAAFRTAIRQHKIHYGVAVRKDLKVRRLDEAGIRRGPATTVQSIAKKAKYRRITWTGGSKGALSSSFAFVRVIPEAELNEHAEAEAVWLVIERPDNEEEKFQLCSLAKNTSYREIVRLLHLRWKTERVYQDLKQEFGLDEYQGRSFVGWHHHVTAAMVCMAFATAEQARLFPPRPTSVTTDDKTLTGSTPAAFRRIHGDSAQADSAPPSSLAPALPFVPSTDTETGQIRLYSNVTQ